MLLHTTPTKCVYFTRMDYYSGPASHSLDVEKQSRPTLNHEAGVKRARCAHVHCTLHKKPSQWWRIGEVNLSIWIPPYFSRIWWDYLCALKPIWQGMVVLYFGMGSLHAHREPPSVINFPFSREGSRGSSRGAMSWHPNISKVTKYMN